MTFDEWFVTYPLPAEIDAMDDTDREQWTWALRSAYKTGAASKREWVGLTDEEIERGYETTGLLCALSNATTTRQVALARAIEAKLKEKNNG